MANSMVRERSESLYFGAKKTAMAKPGKVVEKADAPGDASTPYTIKPGDTFFGDISVAGDMDAIRFHMEAGYGYVVSVTSKMVVPPQLCLEARALDAAGQPLAYTWYAWAKRFDIFLNADSEEDVLLEISESFTNGTATGGYTVALTREVMGGAGTGATLSPHQTVRGKIQAPETSTSLDEIVTYPTGEGSYWDSDWFRVDLLEGYDYYFTLDNVSLSNGLPRLELFDASGVLELADYRKQAPGGAGATIGKTTSADGTMFVGVEAVGSATWPGAYDLTMSLDTAASAATKSQLWAGDVIDIDFGAFVAGGVRDHDWHRVEMLAGYDYVFNLTSDTSFKNGKMTIRDANGDVIHSVSRTSAGEMSVSHAPAADGVFYLDVELGINAAKWAKGADLYQLEMVKDTANDVGTQDSLVAGVPIKGVFDDRYNIVPAGVLSGDHDFYRLDVKAGDMNTIVVQLDQWDIQSSYAEVGLHVYDEKGNLKAWDQSGAVPKAVLGYKSKKDGVVYVSVQFTPYEDFAPRPSYTLTVDNDISPILGDSGKDRLTGTLNGEFLQGKAGDDKIDAGGGWDHVKAGPGDDTVKGGVGNDKLFGGDGDDTLLGGDDQDVLWGNKGADRLFGGAGDDTLSGAAGADELDGGDGRDRLDGGKQRDVLRGQNGDDQLIGGAGKDRLEGGAGRDKLDGGKSADKLTGGDGDDILLGGDGDDRLKGGDGDDRLEGGAGDDALVGGAGDDTFVFSGGHDRIADFTAGSDVLLVSIAGTNISSRQALFDASQVVDGAVVFTLAPDHSLTLDGITDIAALQGSVWTI